MAVQDIVRALGSDYSPTNAYSLEYRPSTGRGLELFLLLAPEGCSVTETTRGEVGLTHRGAFFSDHGNAPKNIEINGSCHYYHSAVPFGTDAAGTARAGPELLDGYSEIHKIKYMFMRFRDYTMSEQGRSPTVPFGSQSALLPALALQQLATERIESGKGVLADEVTLVWHAYDQDDHFIVRVDSMTVNETSSDPFTAYYSIRMTGYLTDDLALRRGRLAQSRSEKATPIEALSGLDRAFRESHPYTIPETIEVPLIGGTAPLPGAESVEPPTIIF